jgi:hypothetical protein
MTNLAKSPFGLEWTNGNTLIKYCKDPEALRKTLSEGLYGAIALYSNETKKEAVKMMIADVLEDFAFEDVSVLVDTIKDIRKGKRKIYGKVTPFDLREMITEKLEEQAIKRERQHQDKKGHGDVELEERTSGRLSDFFKKDERKR